MSVCLLRNDEEKFIEVLPYELHSQLVPFDIQVQWSVHYHSLKQPAQLLSARRVYGSRKDGLRITDCFHNHRPSEQTSGS